MLSSGPNTRIGLANLKLVGKIPDDNNMLVMNDRYRFKMLLSAVQNNFRDLLGMSEQGSIYLFEVLMQNFILLQT